jgi:hypothetical protein
MRAISILLDAQGIRIDRDEAVCLVVVTTRSYPKPNGRWEVLSAYERGSGWASISSTRQSSKLPYEENII